MLIERLFAEAANAIPIARGLLFFARAIPRCVVSLMMTVITIGHAFDEGRSFAAAGSLDGSRSSFPNRDSILAVNGYTRHRISCSAVGDARDGDRVLHRSRLRVAVVFANED